MERLRQTDDPFRWMSSYDLLSKALVTGPQIAKVSSPLKKPYCIFGASDADLLRRVKRKAINHPRVKPIKQGNGAQHDENIAEIVVDRKIAIKYA